MDAILTTQTNICDGNKLPSVYQTYILFYYFIVTINELADRDVTSLFLLAQIGHLIIITLLVLEVNIASLTACVDS